MIKKRLIETYLKKEIRPVLGEEWQICNGSSIIRRTGTLVQGIHFDRSGYSDSFYLWYANQVLAIPDESLHFTLGSRFKDMRGGDVLLDWAPDDKSQTELLLHLIREQTLPPIDNPLTLEAVAHYVEKEHLKSHHFYVHWALGVIGGLLGRLDEAKKQLNNAENDLRFRVKGWEKAGKSVPQWMIENLKELAKFQEKLTDVETLTAFCEENTAKTAALLKIRE